MLTLLSFAALVGCSGGEEDSADLPWGPLSGDSGAPEDTSEPLDSGVIVPELFAPPAALWQAANFTVEPARGLTWELDTTFSLDNRALPEFYIRGDGTIVMLSSVVAEGKSRVALPSADGDVWDRTNNPFISPEDFEPLNCGTRLDDGFVSYEADGTYTLFVEGAYIPDGGETPDWSVWCRATSADGDSFTPDVDGYAYVGIEVDGNRPGDAGAITLSDDSSMAFYNGVASGDPGGVRLALRGAGEREYVSINVGDVLPAPAIEANPVYLEGGGLRLFYVAGENGGIAFVDAPEGLPEGEGTVAVANTGTDCSVIYTECYRDPAYLLLPDGRMALYFTRVMLENDGYSYAIQRAWATD